MAMTFGSIIRDRNLKRMGFVNMIIGFATCVLFGKASRMAARAGRPAVQQASAASLEPLETSRSRMSIECRNRIDTEQTKLPKMV